MPRVMACLRDRKVWCALLFIGFVLIPLSAVYCGWLIDFRWWSPDEWRHIEEEGYYSGNATERLDNIRHQLGLVRCPARLGLDLKDYWECLWKTSITPEGKEQHARFLWEDYVDRVDLELEEMERRLNETLGKRGDRSANRRRVRRQAPVYTSYNYSYLKAASQIVDTLIPLLYFDQYVQTRQDVKSCQQGILPGESIYDFLLCIRKISKSLNEQDPIFFDSLGKSFFSTFQPTTLPPWNKSDYDKSDFPPLSMVDERTGVTYDLRFDFQPLGTEEHPDNFLGGDPYLEDDWSVYRYRYDNLKNQKNPGWTYRGGDSSKQWHKLNLERFLLPLEKKANLEEIVLIDDLAQSYPGIGEIADSVSLSAPIDYRWNKDSGYNVFTRFLLPLLTKKDLEYYKTKKLVKPYVTYTAPWRQLSSLIRQLKKFKDETDDVIAGPDGAGGEIINPIYANTDDDDIPYAKVYKKFLTHFFHLDLGKYQKDKRTFKNATNATLKGEMEIVRKLLHFYVDAVTVQESCVKNMIFEDDDKLVRLEDAKEIADRAIFAIGYGHGCKAVGTLEDAISDLDPNYKMVYDNMPFLYNAYFDRKAARQRYSLPKYPVEFPICEHNEPSPIDIKTNRGRKSSLRDYTFGPAAYRLNRFFMFFPLDGVPLLTVGIKDGERLDGSAVSLNGGAVKGQNLTFQYMHIRFGSSWKSVGSEHWIDGKGAAVELQMIFTIAGSADSIKYWHVLARMQNQLFQFREKLVVILSVLVDVLETDQAVKDKIKDEELKQDPYVFESLAQAAYHFRRIPQKFPKYEEPRGYVSVDPVFRFIDFIPHKAGKFYTYRGSLSWPPCFGYVIWSVYEQRLYMSKRQFDQFAEIPAYGIQEHNLASENFRQFEDIWVEEEKDPSLSYDQIDDLKRLRTADRHFLIGYHDVNEQGREQEGGVVGEEMYYRVAEDSAPKDFTGFWSVKSLERLVLTMALVLLLFF